MAKRRVLVTGAGGYIAAQLLPVLSENYDLVLTDVAGVEISKFGKVQAIDIAAADEIAVRRLFEKVDTVIHNAHHSDKNLITAVSDHWMPSRSCLDSSGYHVERVNVDMAFRVLKSALDEGVRRVILTSSNHAADWYETLVHKHQKNTVDPMEYPLADNFYGWAKAAYEMLGFAFATGRYGRKLEVVAVRIGAPRKLDGELLKDDPAQFHRDLGAYVSPRDLQQLYVRAIETADIENEGNVPFQVVYGVSNNTRAFWSIVNARRIFGYDPVDDSEIVFAEDIRRYLISPARSRGAPAIRVDS